MITDTPGGSSGSVPQAAEVQSPGRWRWSGRWRWPGWRGSAIFLVRRVPFTTAVVVAMLVAGVVTGALWRPIETLRIYPWVAFGVPAFAEGRWYTLAFGAFFALVPVFYVFVAGGFALLVGFAEYRLGTVRTILVTAGGQLVGVLGAAAVLAIARGTSWPWGQRIAAMTDVGFSAGMLAAVCVASVTVAAPWGLRIRLATAAYAGLSLLYVGLMADLEHGIAVLAGWSLAGIAAGPRAVRQKTTGAAEWRVLGTAGLVVVTLLQLVVRLFPGTGPTGTAEHGTLGPLVWHVVVAVVGLATAWGWYRGRRWALLSGLGLVTVELVVMAVVGTLGLTGALPGWVRVDAPTVFADAVSGLAVMVLLIRGARAGAVRVSDAVRSAGRASTDGAGSEK